MTPHVRQLRPEDAPALVALRREALQGAPLAFGSSPEDDRGRSLEFMQASLADVREQAIFGCFIDDELAGMVGVRRESKAKVRHQSMIWGMYVAPRARGKGAGRSLLLAAIEYARAWQDVEQIHLGVTTGAPAAARLYEAAGFRQWGYQRRAIQHDGIFVDEAHMVLDLREEPGNSPSL